MAHILRAFAWMRWRVLINSFEKTNSRDRVQRLSFAVEHLTPIVAALVLIPSAIGIAILSGFAGFVLASAGATSIPFQIVRVILLAATIFSIVGPLVLPVAERTNPVRFLLLPIPTRVLYIAQSASAVMDPWILLVIPLTAGLSTGLFAGGAPSAAVVALTAAVALIITLVGMSALATTLLHLLMRDRRRGEIVALIFILVIPLVSFLPSVIGSTIATRAREQDRDRGAIAERPLPQRRGPPPWLRTAATRTFALAPSELYTTAISRSVRGGRRGVASPLMALTAGAIAVHVVGLLVYGRVLSLPGTSGRRSATWRRLWNRRLPGVSPGSSTVALALLRLAMRTPRGRSILLTPLVMLAFLSLVVARSGSFTVGPFPAGNGLGLAILVAFVALIATLPIAMNQFAVDGAGLTMVLLSPLSTRHLLIGKALGIGLMAMPAAVAGVCVIWIAFGGAPAGLWIAVLFALPATIIGAAPVAAICSAVFPRVVDMNSVGRGSNAHGVSAFVGLLAFVAAAAPNIILMLFAQSVLERSWAAPILIVIWSAAALAIARLLLEPAERIFDKRRESLALLL